MDEFDIEKADRKLEALIKKCDRKCTEALAEGNGGEYFFLKTVHMKMTALRYKMKMADGFMSFWDSMADTECEDDFQELADFCFGDLLVEFHLNIWYFEQCRKSDLISDIISDWNKLCTQYMNFYKPIIDSFR